MRKFRNRIFLLSLAFVSMNAAIQSAFADPFIDNANLLADKVDVVQKLGTADQAKQVLLELTEFRHQYQGRVVPPFSDNFDLMKSGLQNWLAMKSGLDRCHKTNADAANRIFSAMNAITSPSTCPAMAKENDLLAFHQKVAGEAMANALRTTLQLRKKYENKKVDQNTIEAELDHLCPTSDNFCSKELRSWLKSSAKLYLDSEDFEKIKYRDPKTVSASLSNQFAALNAKSVLSSGERKYYNIYDRNNELQGLHSRMLQKYKQDPYGHEYQTEKEQYETKLKDYLKDEKSLKTLQPYSNADAMDYTDHETNFGLRNACLGKSTGKDEKQLYSDYQKSYVAISSCVDGMLLFTDSMKKNRMQTDGWLSDAHSCPDIYPMDFGETQIKKAEEQAIAEAKRSAEKIRYKIHDISNISNSYTRGMDTIKDPLMKQKNEENLKKRLNQEGSEWVRSFQPAVAQVLRGQPEQGENVCGMIYSLERDENAESIRNQIMIGASVIAVGTMLIVPALGEAGAALTLTSATGMVSGLAAVGSNGINYFNGSQEGELIISSIMSGNADLRTHVEDGEVRNKVGQAYRRLVLDAGLTSVQAIAFLSSLSKVDQVLLEAPQKKMMVSDPEKLKTVDVQFGMLSRDEAGNITPTVVNAKVVKPDNGTPIGKVAKSLAKDNSIIIISKDVVDKEGSIGSFSQAGTVVTPDGKVIKAPAVILRETDSAPGGIVGHEGGHAKNAANRVKGGPQSRYDGTIDGAKDVLKEGRPKKPLPGKFNVKPDLEVKLPDGTVLKSDEIEAMVIKQMQLEYPNLNLEEIQQYSKNFTQMLKNDNGATLRDIEVAYKKISGNSRLPANLKNTPELDNIHLTADSILPDSTTLGLYSIRTKYFADSNVHLTQMVEDSYKLEMKTMDPIARANSVYPFQTFGNAVNISTPDLVYTLRNIPKAIFERINALKGELAVAKNTTGMSAVEMNAVTAKRLDIAKEINTTWDDYVLKTLDERKQNSVNISAQVNHVKDEMKNYQQQGYLTANQYLNLKDEMAKLGNSVNMSLPASVTRPKSQ